MGDDRERGGNRGDRPMAPFPSGDWSEPVASPLRGDSGGLAPSPKPLSGHRGLVSSLLPGGHGAESLRRGRDDGRQKRGGGHREVSGRSSEAGFPGGCTQAENPHELRELPSVLVLFRGGEPESASAADRAPHRKPSPRQD